MDTEKTMDEVVEAAGGQRVGPLLPAISGAQPKNADYVFLRDNAVAGLKTLQAQVFTPSYQQKLQLLVRRWINLGLIRVYGRTNIEMRSLPKQCQQEWLRLITRSLQNHVISSANKQISEAKNRLGLPVAKGILLLANDRNFGLDPYNLIVLVSHILKKHHADGSPQYSCIDAVCFFSANLPVSSPDFPTPAVFWMNGHRHGIERAVSELLQKLEHSWYERLSKKAGFSIPRVALHQDQVEELRLLGFRVP